MQPGMITVREDLYANAWLIVHHTYGDNTSSFTKDAPVVVKQINGFSD